MLSPGPQRSFSTVCGGTVMFMSASPQPSARTQHKAKSHHSKRSLLPGLRCSGAASRAVTGRARTVVDMHTPAALVPAKLRLFLHEPPDDHPSAATPAQSHCATGPVHRRTVVRHKQAGPPRASAQGERPRTPAASTAESSHFTRQKQTRKMDCNRRMQLHALST